MGTSRETRIQPYTLGVLFVHGMGGQHSGGTLHQFCDPLYEWLRRWAAGGGKSELASATLRDVRLDRDSDAPAHATIDLTHADETTQRWLLAESHWADEFRPPAFSRMLGWLLTLAPWITCEYMRAVWARELTRRSRKNRAKRWGGMFTKGVVLLLASVLGPLLCGLGVVVLLALRVLSVLPIESLRTKVEGIVRGLVGSLGDVFTIVESPLDREAILGRIARDRAWLEQQGVDKVVVVAHSAGAALTYRLLTTAEERPDARKPDLYVTLGQAIWRMYWVDGLRDRRTVTRVLAGLGSLALVMGAAGLLVESWTDRLPVYAWVALALAGFDLCGILTAYVWEHVGGDLRTAIVREGIDAVGGTWHDYVASSDPVPAGRLATLGAAPGTRFLVGIGAAATFFAGIVGWSLDWPAPLGCAFVAGGLGLAAHAAAKRDSAGDPPATLSGTFTSTLIRSHRTLVTDHVTYPGNVEGFLTPLVERLSTLTGRPLSVPSAGAAGTLRRHRTAALALGRAVYLTCAVWLLIALAAKQDGDEQSRLYALGGWLRSAANWVVTGEWKDIAEGEKWLLHGRVGLAAVAAGLAAGLALLLGLWSAWDRVETKRLFEGKDSMAEPTVGRKRSFWAARLVLPPAAAVLALLGATDDWRRAGWVMLALSLLGGIPASLIWNRDSDL